VPAATLRDIVKARNDLAKSVHYVTQFTICNSVLSSAGKGKGHPITRHEGTEREYRCSYVLSLTSALGGGGWSMPAPAALPPGTRPGTHCTGGWVGPRDGLDGCGKSQPHWDSIPGPSSP
jgi:hypothetical protein